ncbi:MAG: dihydrodipicolinate synthase family protein [Thermoanaerobaculia bacterium]|nr:dihydrodipicolinate synthase family protein [Thermoanaerobaculia bacterium]
MRFEGIYAPVITPFHEDYSIDHEGYARCIDHLIASGIHGIVVGGTTGENYALTKAERIAQFHTAHRQIDGRVPWIAGVNDIQTEEVCAFGVAAREAGADALLLAVPPYSIPTAKELALHALKVDREVDLPIMLYNYPGRSGTDFSEEFLERVGGSRNFCAIKESSGDLNRIHLLARDFPHLQLSCGADDQALEFFVWGARSWVCAAANFIPAETLALYEACAVRGDFDTGRRIMKALLPLMTVLERGGKFVQCVKFALELDGLPGGAVRLPLRPMKKELKRSLREALHTARSSVALIVAAQTSAKDTSPPPARKSAGTPPDQKETTHV